MQRTAALTTTLAACLIGLLHDAPAGAAWRWHRRGNSCPCPTYSAPQACPPACGTPGCGMGQTEYWLYYCEGHHWKRQTDVKGTYRQLYDHAIKTHKPRHHTEPCGVRAVQEFTIAPANTAVGMGDLAEDGYILCICTPDSTNWEYCTEGPSFEDLYNYGVNFLHYEPCDCSEPCGARSSVYYFCISPAALSPCQPDRCRCRPTVPRCVRPCHP